MKTAIPFSNHGKRGSVRGCPVSITCLAAMIVVLFGFGGIVSNAHAQPSDHDEPGAEVLTRGPVHEAFAGIISYDAEAGVEVTKAPPDPIEEVPPEERPAGDNVAWIPGYWAWDDERSDFLWISGTWRALPPGREWLAGYWGPTAQGYQWTSGYWADANEREATYLPPPPETVEAGPNIESPSADYEWTPGCWLWHRGRYAWRPGYWTLGRADWDWTPAHYVWTPRGFIFVDGFWDYPVERRGILFAPVYFEPAVYARRGYRYSPTIVISLGVFSDHLFLRPRYQHYYFGDYYAERYQQGGIYASFSFQTGRHGYDPFYARQRWAHRSEQGWDHRVAASYQYRRDNEAARPPRTWSAQRKIDSRSPEFTQNRVEVAVSIGQLAKRKDGPVRFQPVARDERRQIVQRGQDVQKSREQRRTLEASVEKPSALTPGAAVAPTKVRLPRSPIVAKPADKMGRNQAPPKVQQAPKPDPKFQPKVETPRRQPGADRNNPQPQSRQLAPERKSAPARNEVAPGPPPAQPTSEERAKDSRVKTAAPVRLNPPEREQKKQSEGERRTKAESKNKEAEAQRNAQAAEQREQEAALKAREQSPRNAEKAQRNTPEMEMKARQQAEADAKVSALRAQEEAQRNAQASAQKPRRESVQPSKETPGADKKHAPRPPKKEQRKEEKRKPPAPEEEPAR